MKLTYFRIGAIGMILIAILTPIHFIVYFLGWMYLLPTGPFALYFLMLLVTAIILFVGFIFAGIGFFGYYKSYGSIWGLAGFLIPLLFSWTLMLVEVYYFLEFWTFIITPPWLPFPLTEDFLYWLLKDTFLALTPILWSLAVFQLAPHTGNKRRTQIAGVLLLVSGLAYLPQIILDVYGASLVPYLLVISIGTAILCLASLLNSVIFLTETVT
jgi:hypothetical protein